MKKIFILEIYKTSLDPVNNSRTIRLKLKWLNIVLAKWIVENDKVK